ncbi:hypothetical protein HMPREF0290_0849 [Corynebacterium efficiens YS-314]|nr:hypothetical protein HMPREF0290_0849 [Corynebacterium efficiens YS-314]
MSPSLSVRTDRRECLMWSTPQCLTCHHRSVMLWIRQQQEKGNPMSLGF